MKKLDIANLLGVSTSRYSKLRDPRYDALPTDAELQALATLLNQSPDYVRRLYPRAA